MATRGERGWQGDVQDHPGPAALGRIREAESRAAAGVLRLRGLELLDYPDGELNQASTNEAIGRIVASLRRIRPQVVVTFGPDGATGHPDHIAISQLTTAALICAADPGYVTAREWPSHRVASCTISLVTRQNRGICRRLRRYRHDGRRRHAKSAGVERMGDYNPPRHQRLLAASLAGDRLPPLAASRL